MAEWLQARPTLYGGVMMRSRLEASFAGALDHFGLSWRYEPFVIASSKGQWLPDFEVPTPDPNFHWYVEVKPDESTAFSAGKKVIDAADGPDWLKTYEVAVTWPDTYPAGDEWWLTDGFPDSAARPHWLKWYTDKWKAWDVAHG